MDSSIANSSSSFALLFFHMTKPTKANPPTKTKEPTIHPTTNAFLVFAPIFFPTAGVTVFGAGVGLGSVSVGTSICKVELNVHDFTLFFSKLDPVEAEKPIVTHSVALELRELILIPT
ncbi:hypothetical protein CsSME_00048044 [Camellia sinensis var. sinensis]